MKNIYRHGDLVFTQVNELPKFLSKLKNADSVVLALGEVTGHKHVMRAEKKEDMEIYKDSQGRFVLSIKAPTKLSHEEHSTLVFQPGIYVMDNEREHDYFDQSSKEVLD